MSESIGPVAPALHPWDVMPVEAVAIQRQLAPLVGSTPPIRLEDVRVVAGVDVSYADCARAAVVAFSYPEMERLDEATATLETPFPYVPGLLSFREAPVALAALARLATQPDLLLCDGQGVAHPRRFGLACHLGVVTGLPTVGCAKSRLVGSYEEPGIRVGERAALMAGDETLGAALRTRVGSRPLFVSVGYRVTLEQAVEVTLRCLRGYRLPEPTRAADRLASVMRRDGTRPDGE